MKTIFTALAFALVAVCHCQTKDTINTLNRYQGPIIDMHLHAFDDHSPLLGLTHPPTLRGESRDGVKTAKEQMDKTLEVLRKSNVVKAVVTNGERWADAGGHMIVNARSSGSAQEMRQLHADGKLDVIAELAPFYDGVLADDPKLADYFALAEELQIPLGIHILPGGPNYGLHMMPQMLGKMRASNANPLQLEPVLVKHPNLKLYIMHAAWPYVEDLKALMYMFPNLYVELAVVNWILPEKECHKFIKELIDAGFGQRIMYGSDQMSWPEVIDTGIQTVQNADITLEQKADIFYNNAARFLGLSQEEIKEHHKK